MAVNFWVVKPTLSPSQPLVPKQSLSISYTKLIIYIIKTYKNTKEFSMKKIKALAQEKNIPFVLFLPW